jgi:hypothetical protein
VTKHNTTTAFEPTEDDCKLCTYDKRGFIINVCGECQDLGQRAIEFLISAKLLKQKPEGSA